MQRSADGKQPGRFSLVSCDGESSWSSVWCWVSLSVCNDEWGCRIPWGFAGEDLSLVAAAFSGIQTSAAPEVIRRLQHVWLEFCRERRDAGAVLAPLRASRPGCGSSRVQNKAGGSRGGASRLITAGRYCISAAVVIGSWIRDPRGQTLYLLRMGGWRSEKEPLKN